MVVAWRIFYLNKLGRERPEAPCTEFFKDEQWKALSIYKNRDKAPMKPPTLYQAMRLTASLGGFIGRKCDGEPGTITLWRGNQRLDDLTEMYLIVTNMMPLAPQPLVANILIILQEVRHDCLTIIPSLSSNSACSSSSISKPNDRRRHILAISKEELLGSIVDCRDLLCSLTSSSAANPNQSFQHTGGEH